MALSSEEQEFLDDMANQCSAFEVMGTSFMERVQDAQNMITRAYALLEASSASTVQNLRPAVQALLDTMESLAPAPEAVSDSVEFGSEFEGVDLSVGVESEELYPNAALAEEPDTDVESETDEQINAQLNGQVFLTPLEDEQNLPLSPST